MESEILNNWLHSAASVTKYDPSNRDGNGVYVKDDWSEYTDIGKRFDTGILSRQEYLLVEAKYVHCAQLFLGYLGCTSITIRSLENYIGYRKVHADGDLELVEKFTNIADCSDFDVSDLVSLVTAILRNLIWCEIHCINSNALIRFASNSYMYFLPAPLPVSLVEEIERCGLFVIQ